ncbi:MAG: right-handed parallel beta-helix repeat-containing protein [Pirellulaceae bacterium]
MFKTSVGRWVMLALVIALAAWGGSHILPGVQLAAQNEEQERRAIDERAAHFVKRDLQRADGVVDDSAAIQRAVESKAGTIVLPAGTYRITKTIEVNLDEVGWTAFVGDGTARILMAGPGPAIRFTGTHEGTADPASVKDNVWNKQRMPRVSGIEIVGSHPEADGIEASGTMQLTIESTLLRELRHGVRLVKRNRNVLISACHIYHCRGVGVYLDHVNLHQTNIVGSHISYNGGGGVVVRGGEVRNVHISGCDIEANMDLAGEPTANVLFDSTEGSMAEGAIVGCTIQHARTTPERNSANIRILGKGVFTTKGKQQEVNCGHITIGDNVLSDIQTNIHLAGARGVTITGNTFWQGYKHNLLVEDSSQIVLGANLMERNPMYGYTDEAKNNVVFKNCRDCTISGLQLHNVQESDAGLTLAECQRMHVTGNTILDCGKVGMLLTNVTDSRVGDNVIRDDRLAAGDGAAGSKNIPLKTVGGRGNWFTGNMWTGQPSIDAASGTAQNNFATQVERGGEK